MASDTERSVCICEETRYEMYEQNISIILDGAVTGCLSSLSSLEHSEWASKTRKR